MKTTGRSSAGMWCAETVALVEVGRDAEVEDADQLVDGSRRARAAEDDRVLVAVGPTGLADDVARVLAKAGRLQAGATRLRVGIGVERHDLVADVVLDEGQAATRRGVVSVRQTPYAEGTVEGLVVADDAATDECQQLVGVGAGVGRSGRDWRWAAAWTSPIRSGDPGIAAGRWARPKATADDDDGTPSSNSVMFRAGKLDLRELHGPRLLAEDQGQRDDDPRQQELRCERGQQIAAEGEVHEAPDIGRSRAHRRGREAEHEHAHGPALVEDRLGPALCLPQRRREAVPQGPEARAGRIVRIFVSRHRHAGDGRDGLGIELRTRRELASVVVEHAGLLGQLLCAAGITVVERLGGAGSGDVVAQEPQAHGRARHHERPPTTAAAPPAGRSAASR